METRHCSICCRDESEELPLCPPLPAPKGLCSMCDAIHGHEGRGSADPTCRFHKHRASYLTVSQQFDLNVACNALNIPFGRCTYHVGSSLTKADYHDVDVRCILDDAEYDKMFGNVDQRQGEGRRLFLNTAISEWIGGKTGLPIDFQFQRQTQANLEFKGQRNFVGH